MLAAVEADPATVGLQIRLAAARLAAEPFARWVSSLIPTDRWHAGSQTAALTALAEGGQPAEELERAKAVWAAAADAGARWLALRMLVRAADAQGWTAERRRRLDAYRLRPEPASAGRGGVHVRARAGLRTMGQNLSC